MACTFLCNQAIVVGGGLGGMSAANTVVENGGRVVLLDKSSFCGGNSTKATSGINGAGTKTQKAKNIPDTAEIFTQDTLKGGAKKPELAKLLCVNSAADVDWLVEKFNLDLSLVARLGGHSQPRTHRGKERFPGMTITYALIQMLEKVAEKTDLARIVTKAKVFKLVTEGNVCVGCVYEKGGQNFQEFGPVILASGGFGADFTSNSLLAQYRPDLLHLPTTNGEHCTGDGIKMGEAIGAKSIDLEWVQVHPTGLVKPDDADAKIKFLAAEALRGVGGIILNAEGKRFCNELGRRDYVTGEMWKSKPPFRLCLNKAASDEIIWHCKHYTGRGVMKFYSSGEMGGCHPGAVPLLQCHIGTAASPLSYPSPNKAHRTTSSLHQWFKNVNKSFAKRLPPLNINHLAGVVVSHGGYTIVGIPGHLHHQTVENTLKKLAKSWKERIKVFVVIPFTDQEMFMMQTYDVSQLPAVIVFSSQEWRETEKPLFVLQSVREVEERRLEIMLVTLHSQAHQLNLGNFMGEVLETKHPAPPMAVCFYSPRNPRTLNYLNAFHRSYDTFTRMQVSLRFGILNIVDYPEVVSRYVNASDVYAVPFTVVFWQERELTTQKFTTKQQVFDKDIPTPLLLFEFLQMLPVNLHSVVPEDDDDDEPYNPWKESDDTKNVCNVLLQDACAIGDNSTVIDMTGFQQNDVMFGPPLPPPSWPTKAKVQSKMKKKTFQFEYVNDKTWASLIEQSVGPVKSYTALPRKQSSRLFSVALVVFLLDGCSYCAKILPTIEKISLDAKYVGASVFVHNCSSDPLTCERYSITGYPTLTAFRSLSWSTVESCSSSHSTYLRLDYHGVVFAKDVLEWLSNISQPAVDRTYLFDSIPDMDVDVRLIGTLYTRSLARRYLATTLVNKWYPFNCFQLVCELLYGRVPCYVTYTRDVVDDGSKVNAKDQDLVLSKLELQRSDGVRVKVFQLGQSVESLINNQRDTRLHMFHDTHRYDLPKNFKCEHDHKICTDIAVRFVQDHRRLPVLHMTSAAFHTKLGSEENANFEPFAHNLPILFALAHKNNVSKDSSFYKELTESAYALYSEMVFVTLDIDEFDHWASRFVPKDYHAKHAFGRQAENVPALYHYPRLCIIQHHDHQHAAFYPPIEEMQRLGTRVQTRLDQITSQQIIKFVQDYLKDPAALIVKTEFF